jgi:hypothetical protein
MPRPVMNLIIVFLNVRSMDAARPKNTSDAKYFFLKYYKSSDCCALRKVEIVILEACFLTHKQPICTHTISQSANPSHAYPIIRLPRSFSEWRGRGAESEIEGV